MKRIRKSIAMLLIMLMVVTSLPLSSFADSSITMEALTYWIGVDGGTTYSPSVDTPSSIGARNTIGVDDTFAIEIDTTSISPIDDYPLGFGAAIDEITGGTVSYGTYQIIGWYDGSYDPDTITPFETPIDMVWKQEDTYGIIAGSIPTGAITGAHDSIWVFVKCVDTDIQAAISNAIIISEEQNPQVDPTFTQTPALESKTATTATFSLSATTGDKVYWATLPETSAAPTAEELKAMQAPGVGQTVQTMADDAVHTFTATTLPTNASYVGYFVVERGADLGSTVSTVPFELGTVATSQEFVVAPSQSAVTSTTASVEFKSTVGDTVYAMIDSAPLSTYTGDQVKASASKTVIADGTMQTIQFTGLSPSTLQHIYIVNERGSNFSNVTTVNSTTTAVPVVAPPSPLNVVATAGDRQVSLAFSAPASDGGSPITGYKVYNTATNTVIASGASSPITVTGLVNGTSYTFAVSAVNAVGEGPKSTASTAVTPVLPITIPVADRYSSVVTMDKTSVIADNTTCAEMTIYVYDAKSNPVPNCPVFIASSRGKKDSVTNDGYTAFAAIDGTYAGETAAGTPGAVSATPSALGAGNATYAVVTDASGKAVVKLSSGTTGSAKFGVFLAQPTAANASVTAANFQKFLNGTIDATVNPNSLQTIATKDITFASAANHIASFASVDRTTLLADNTSYSEMTIYTYDANNKPVPNCPVFIASSRGMMDSVTNDGYSTFAAIDGIYDGETAAGTLGAVLATPAALGTGKATYVVVTDASGKAVVKLSSSTAGTAKFGVFLAQPTAANASVTAANFKKYLNGSTDLTVNATSLQAMATRDIRFVAKTTAPQNVSASAGDKQATLTFDAPASNGGSPIVGYKVYNAATNTFITFSPSSPITVTGLVNGTSYTFAVSVVTADGEGPKSTASSAVTPVSLSSAPQNVSASAGDKQATLTFDAPASNGGSAITGYKVYNAATNTVIASGTSSPINVTGLVNGTSYTFAVSAVNAVGEGPKSTVTSSVTPVSTSSAPQNVSASAGDKQATITFNAPASNGGSPITGYKVYNTATNAVIASGASSPITATGLVNGTSYTFAVSAVNAVGEGPKSTVASAVTPVSLSSAPQNVKVSAGDKQATLTFDVPASNGGSPITSYKVYNTATNAVIASGASSPITVTGLVNGTSYTFAVSAVNAAGEGPKSTVTSAVTPVSLSSAPQNVSASAGDKQATITFNAPASNGGSPITSYKVYNTATNAVIASGASSPITATGLVNGTSYTFAVSAVNAAGEGPKSTVTSAVTPVSLSSAPQNVKVSAGDKQATLTFDAPASNGGSPITSYKVYNTATNAVIASGASSPITVTGLVNGTSYTFAVSAVNAAGEGPKSTTISATIPVLPLSVPQNVKASAGDKQVTLTFDAPSSNGGSPITSYKVYNTATNTVIASGASSPITVTGLVNGTSYTFAVSAQNAVGEGPKSTTTAIATPAAVAVAGGGGAGAITGGGGSSTPTPSTQSPSITPTPVANPVVTPSPAVVTIANEKTPAGGPTLPPSEKPKEVKPVPIPADLKTNVHASKVQMLLAKGIVKVDRKGNFKPNDPEQRIEFLNSVAKLMDVKPSRKKLFKGLSPTNPMYPVVEALFEKGVIPATMKFNMSKPLTEAEVNTILSRVSTIINPKGHKVTVKKTGKSVTKLDVAVALSKLLVAKEEAAQPVKKKQ